MSNVPHADILRGKEVMGTLKVSQSHSAKMSKRIGEMRLDIGQEKRRKINMSQLTLRRGGPAKPIASQKEATTTKGERNASSIDKPKPAQNTSFGGYPKTATGRR